MLLDFVPSHSSWKHPAFLEAQADRSAPTSSWYTFDEWPDDYRCFLQVSKHLPSINTQDPSARRHLIDAARHWITEYGVDGFRLDHSIGAGMDFWVEFQQAIARARSDVVTIAEATDTPDYLRHYRGRLNCVLDFELAAMLRMSFGQGDIDLQHLDTFVTAYERFMGRTPARVSFLDNHDMDRFLWIAANDRKRLQLAALCQFTLRPTPAIYYGTEIGLTQERSAGGLFGGDEEARRDMPWDSRWWDEDMLSFYRSLIRVRKENSSVWQGDRTLLKIDAEKGFWAYLCTAPKDAGGNALLVALNLGEHSQELELPEEVLAVEPLISVGSVDEVRSRRLRFQGSSALLLSPV